MRHITRRDFVKGVAAGAAVAATGRAHAQKVVRVGVIGAGVAGTQHIERLSDMNDAMLVAVADDDVAARDLIMRDDIDAVIIATPEDSHAPLSVAALTAGKHVYCEAPMALNFDDAREVARAADASGCAYAIGVDALSDGAWATAKSLVAQGAIGDVRGVHMRYPYTPAEGWRSQSAHCGGVVSDMFYARMLPAIDLIGELDFTRASLAGGSYSDRETWDTGVAHIEFESGARIAIATAPNDVGVDACIVRGTYGTLTFEGNSVNIVAEPGHEADAMVGNFAAKQSSGDQFTKWIAAIQNREERNTDLDLAIAGQRMIAQLA